jgi:hypothetical protein
MLTLKEIHKAVGGTLVLANADAESLKLKAAKEALHVAKINRDLKDNDHTRKYIVQAIQTFIANLEKSNASDLKSEESIPEAEREAYLEKCSKQIITDAIKLSSSKMKTHNKQTVVYAPRVKLVRR